MSTGPDPRRIRTRAELARELDLLRARAAAGTPKARVSLEHLAGLVRLPRSTLHSYLSGQTLVPSEVLDRIIVALGADPAEQREWNEAWYRVHAGAHSDPPDVEPAAAPFCLPPVARGFTGRDAELAELDRLADNGFGAGPVVSAICGAPGVGKTALALRWAHRARDRFPDGCLHVDLRGYDPEPRLPVADAMAVLLGSLAPGEPVPADLAVLAARYRARLAGRRVLVLLDNAADAEQVRPLLPGTGSCLVLVTSRDDLAGLLARDGAYRLRLGVLPLPDALALLDTVLGAGRVAADRRAATVLAQQCGCLPLAIRVAAELAAARPAVSLADLAGEGRLLDRLAAGADPRTDLRAVFSWSYRHLVHGDREAARIFRLLGAHQGADFTAATVAAVAGADPGQVRRSIDTLLRAHLVEPAAAHRFRMHRLLKAYAGELAAGVPEPRSGGQATFTTLGQK
ncbi:MAG TPA: helix-turn-helix domain-containing protein [Actinophytocola sp.]|uniref:helix-turn-helix domain-containing protein n=1 Tax=Actinophytocola sp. TaxID=1872138 RepID=UPI002DDD4767|nr:helix-turn-helix domain-containing protein [Actinophytocola sp.]HEV2782839.1 helix-turn-helix domain-containing protein [Actinophytocola sp.]